MRHSERSNNCATNKDNGCSRLLMALSPRKQTSRQYAHIPEGGEMPRLLVLRRRVGPKGWGNESSGNTANGLDLSLPRLLVEGGFLWKFPYHNAGTPKRRWFQVKPAEGLLTTASGHLVVRPTVGGGGGSGVCERGADRGNESSRAGGGDKIAAPSMPMRRLRAAWPLTFIWVDPERDLKRSPPREILVEEIMDLARGHKTPAFWQQASHRGIHTLPDPKLCFSLVGHDRSLDLAAESLPEAREWVCALARVALMAKRGGSVKTAGDAVAPLLPHRFRPEPAASLAGPDLEESVSAERLNDIDHKVDSHVGVQRQSDRAATALNTEVSRHELSLRSDADLSSEKPKVLGEGGTWSVDTIHAWRRRLFPAVKRGDIAAVLAIFDQGCPVDIAQTGTGDTPMLVACRLGDVGMVRECLRRGSRNDPHPAFGQTALHAAVASGQEACARLILETAAPSRSDAVVSNHKDPNKETPLHVACRRGYDGIVEALLHHGADLRAVDRKGNTPLHGAAGSGHAGALGSLLDAGGDVVLEESNARGDRALHTAAAPGHIACVELLLGTAAEPDVPNADGQTPFALASRGGHLAVTRLIRKYAPAAGTPSGGDAQFQAHRRANEGGRSVTSDTLPRPHSSGSAPNPPGTPDHRSRDLEHRCYSAAGLGHQQFEDLNAPTCCRQPVYTSGGDSFDRDLLRSTSQHDRRQDLHIIDACRSKGVVFFCQIPHLYSIGLYASGGELKITKATPPQSTFDGHVTSPAFSTSAPVQGTHGSLFDGLQVYVVGGRQPLGSQHSCAAPGKMSASLARVPVSARTMVLDSHRLSTASHHHQVGEEQQQHHLNYYPSNQQSSYNSSLSTASFEGLDPNWRDNILSAPSTVAPSPPTPISTPEGDRRPNRDSTSLLSAVPSTATTTGGDGTGIVGVMGSARALARMIHFNNTIDRGESEIFSGGAAVSPSATRTQNLTEKETEEPHGGTAASEKSGGGERTTKPIGCWMTSVDDDQDSSGTSSRAPEVGGKGHGCGAEQTSMSDSPHADAAESFGSHVDTKPVLGRGTSRSGATAGQEAVEFEESEKEGDSFVMVVSQEMGGRQTRDASAALAGLWKVFQSEGYPYYLHEASGHTQWEDPREVERLRVQEFLVDTGATGDVRGESLGECSEPNGEAALLEEHPEEGNGGLRDKTPIEREQSPPPASPIKPAGVPVAVKVARN
ncbi:unnamed protein product [Ectocarpus sp. CCAP 1310/34]|nr:unnamed protein product [Ectocarpus sp. CCAP 1310/34]